MHDLRQSAKLRAERKSMGFNINKFQAFACVAVSIAVSIGLILWGVKTFA